MHLTFIYKTYSDEAHYSKRVEACGIIRPATSSLRECQTGECEERRTSLERVHDDNNNIRQITRFTVKFCWWRMSSSLRSVTLLNKAARSASSSPLFRLGLRFPIPHLHSFGSVSWRGSCGWLGWSRPAGRRKRNDLPLWSPGKENRKFTSQLKRNEVSGLEIKCIIG